MSRHREPNENMTTHLKMKLGGLDPMQYTAAQLFKILSQHSQAQFTDATKNDKD